MSVLSGIVLSLFLVPLLLSGGREASARTGETGPEAGQAGVEISAGEPPWRVRNFPVAATAADAVSARTQALATGQREALVQLLAALHGIPVTRAREITAPLPAGSGVSSLSVREERQGRNSYRALVDVTFDTTVVAGLSSSVVGQAEAEEGNVPPSQRERRISAEFRITGLEQWSRTRQKLGTIPGLTWVDVAGITRGSVYLVLHTSRSPGSLGVGLGAAGIRVGETERNQWILTTDD